MKTWFNCYCIDNDVDNDNDNDNDYIELLMINCLNCTDTFPGKGSQHLNCVLIVVPSLLSNLVNKLLVKLFHVNDKDMKMVIILLIVVLIINSDDN